MYAKVLFEVVLTRRFLALAFGLYLLLSLIYSWMPFVFALKRAYISYVNLSSNRGAAEALASLEDVQDIPNVTHLPGPLPEGSPPIYDPVDWTNYSKLSATLVMECKLELVFTKYSEANKLVVERWINKRLEELGKRGLRLAHRKRVKDKFMVLVFLKDSYEMEMMELQNSAIIQERLKAGLREHTWYYVRDASTLYLPWFRRVLKPTAA